VKIKNNRKNNDTPPEYRHDLAIACALYCDFANLPNGEWLPIFTALVSEGFSREELRGYCAHSSRYNKNHFDQQYDWACNRPTFGITTLIGKAVQVGFVVKDFYKDWIAKHPEFAQTEFYNLSLTTEDWIKFWQGELIDIEKNIADFDAEKDSAIEKIKDLQTFDRNSVFADDILTAAAFAKLYDSKVFSNLKSSIQNQAKAQKESFIGDWKSDVKIKTEEIKKRYAKLLTQRNKIQAKITSLKFILANSDLSNFSIPNGYSISDNGIEKVIGENLQTVCRRPVIIKKQCKDYENDISKLVLAHKSANGRWQELPAQEAATIFNSRKIVDLANKNLPVTSVNSNLVVDFLDAFKSVNENILPITYRPSLFYRPAQKSFYYRR